MKTKKELKKTISTLNKQLKEIALMRNVFPKIEVCYKIYGKKRKLVPKVLIAKYIPHSRGAKK